MPRVKCAYCNQEDDSSKMYRCSNCQRWMCSKCVKWPTFGGGPKCPKDSSHAVEKG
jgi:hypothetical protein